MYAFLSFIFRVLKLIECKILFNILVLSALGSSRQFLSFMFSYQNSCGFHVFRTWMPSYSVKLRWHYFPNISLDM